jgi:hypothetical protein
MVVCTALTLWKQRNARAFGDVRKQKNVGMIVEEIRDQFHLWEKAKRRGSGGRLVVARE